MLGTAWICIRVFCIATCLAAIWLGLSLKDEGNHVEQEVNSAPVVRNKR